MYLLDTDTVIYSLKGEPAVEKNLREHFHDPMKMSVITLMELYYGAHKSQKIASNLAKIKTLEISFQIIPISEESAEIFGMIKAQLEKAGSPIARVSDESSPRDCEDGRACPPSRACSLRRGGRATWQPSRVPRDWFRGVPEWYVAGADTRGRQEGRPYPWSQQVIHEISGLRH